MVYAMNGDDDDVHREYVDASRPFSHTIVTVFVQFGVKIAAECKDGWQLRLGFAPINDKLECCRDIVVNLTADTICFLIWNLELSE